MNRIQLESSLAILIHMRHHGALRAQVRAAIHQDIARIRSL